MKRERSRPSDRIEGRSPDAAIRPEGAGAGAAARLMRPLLYLFLAVPLLVTGCGSESTEPAEDTISREVFITAYVDLRMAALRNPEEELAPTERERILESHGVTSDELLRFVEVHSRDDPRVMQEIWAEVQDRIRRAREEAVAGEAPDGTSDATSDSTSDGTSENGDG